MDLEKVDRLHQSLSGNFMTMCTEADATPTEALVVAMRLFSYFVAAYVADADHARAAMHSEIEAHCREATAMAKARLLEVLEYDLAAGDDEDTGA